MSGVECICRICLAGNTTDADHLLINIFQQQDDSLPMDFSIVETLRNICGLNISEDDQYPKEICLICYSRLEEADKLRRQTLNSHAILSEIIAKGERNDLSTTEFGEETLVFEEEYLDEQKSSVDYDDDVEQAAERSHPDNQKTVSTDVVRIQCCGCEKIFHNEIGLRKHSIRKHRPIEPVVIPSGNVQCNVCYAIFTSEFKVNVHKTGKNNLQTLKKCDFCGCNFFSDEGLDKHKILFHPDGLFKCCSCNLQVYDKDELLEHSRSHQSNISGPKDALSTRKFQCSLCCAHFATLIERQRHERFPYRKYKSKKTNNAHVTVVRCCGCPKVFSEAGELRRHQEEVHYPNRESLIDHEMSIECGGCYKRFKNKFSLNKHLHRAESKKLFACSKCSVSRRTLKQLIEHEATHTGGGAFICCGCREGFESQEALECHSKEVHANRPKVYYNDDDDTVRPFVCNVCYRRYKTARDLRGHQRFVYYEKVHICDICGKGFSQENTLAIHLSTHKTKAEFPCPICSKMYKHGSNVRNCVARHERPKIHKCKVCNVTFPAASNLYSHMISHSDDRRYKCDVCDQSFKRSFHLRKHKNVHNSEKNYPCKYCSSRFCSTTELYKHEIRHTGMYPYECSICSKKLTTRQVYIKHYEAHVDKSEKVFQCHLCSQRYSKDHFLSNHIKYTHRIEPQDKHWNDKFNRQGPARLKGGLRIAGVLGNYSVNDEPVEKLTEIVENGQPDV